MASSTAYIIMLNAKTGVFTLFSEKDKLTIDSSHKKYEWLRGQEAGRIVKISEKGRWNSSRDYNNLYQSIKPKRKAPRKEKIAKTNKDKAGAYCFSFDEKKNHFILIDSNGTQVQINSAHKKFEWLQSQETGRVIKISEKGRWNSSKDYKGLYDEINSTHRKQAKPSVTKPITQKPKSDNSDEIKRLKKEIKHSQSTIHNIRDELKRLGSNYNELKRENAKLQNEKNAAEKAKKKAESDKDLYVRLWNKERDKSQTAQRNVSKPKKVAVSPKKYEAKITANYSFISFYGDKGSEALDIEIVTLPLSKKPTQSFFKAFLKSVSADTSNRQDYKMRKVGIFKCYGIGYINPLHEKRKISGIEIMYIKER